MCKKHGISRFVICLCYDGNQQHYFRVGELEPAAPIHWFILVHPIKNSISLGVVFPDFSRFVSELEVNGFNYRGFTFPGEISFVEVSISCIAEQVPGAVSPAEEVHSGFSRVVLCGDAGGRWLR